MTTRASRAAELYLEPKARIRRSRLRRLVRTLVRRPLGAAGGSIVLIMILIAILAPILAPYEPNEMHMESRIVGPSASFLLGTDNFGRDLLSRIIHGARISLWVGILSLLVGSGTGTLAGLIGGYLGGRTDIIVQRFMDVMMAFPMLVLALVVVAMLGTSLTNVIIAISFPIIPRVARVVRSSALSVKETQYIEAAKSMGAASTRIIFIHVMPNCVAPLIILASAQLGAAILIESSLSFLGLGVPPPHPSWGRMLTEASNYVARAPWFVIFPGVAISLAVFGINLLGDALRDILDPRLRAA